MVATPGTVKATIGTGEYLLTWILLDRRVLLVRVSSDGTNNGAFVGAVEGEDPRKEALNVVLHGSAVGARFAEVYFEGLGSRPLVQLREAEPAFPNLRPPPSEFWVRNPDFLELNPVDTHVLLVAVKARNDSWKALIGAVKGVDYYSEALEVAQTGTEVPYDLAEVCFEDIAKGHLKWHKQLHVFIDGKDYGPGENWGRADS